MKLAAIAVHLAILSALSISEAQQPAKVDVFGDVDIAESNLRLLLNRPASGKFPKEAMTCDMKLESAIRLLNIEQRHPGLLQGNYKYSDFHQYDEVKNLFQALQKKYRFYYPEKIQSGSPSSERQSAQ